MCRTAARRARRRRGLENWLVIDMKTGCFDFARRGTQPLARRTTSTSTPSVHPSLCNHVRPYTRYRCPDLHGPHTVAGEAAPKHRVPSLCPARWRLCDPALTPWLRVGTSQPSVGIGNVGQLALDLILNTHRAKVRGMGVYATCAPAGTRDRRALSCAQVPTSSASALRKIGHFHSVHASPVAGNDATRMRGDAPGQLTVNNEGTSHA